MEKKSTGNVEKPKPSFPINVPMLEGWVQIPDEMKSFHEENAKKYGLFVKGKQLGTVETIGHKGEAKANLSYDFDKLYIYEFESIEAAMCGLEEIVEFYRQFKEKYDKKKTY